MRYRDISDAPAIRAVPRSLIRSKKFEPDVKLVLRFVPGVYRWLDVELHHGGPDADIDLDRARVWFPEIYDADGALTEDCRRWIVEMVRDEVERRGLSICVVFAADDAVYLWPEKEPVESDRAPEGGLPL